MSGPGFDESLLSSDVDNIYFSDPYNNKYSPWVPTISVKHIIALPNNIVYQKADLQRSSGLFPEVNYVWFVNGNSIYLWNYKLKGGLSFPKEISQQITHVLLAKAVPNVFDSSVTHVLVLSTKFEIILYPLSYTPSSGFSLSGGSIRQPTGNVNVLCMTSSENGRIFIGCEDNDIYELDYTYNSNFFLHLMGYGSRGQMTNRTGYLLQLVLPSFIRELSYGENINELLVDDDRHILYCVYKQNIIYGYSLGPTGAEFHYAFALSDISSMLSHFKERASPKNAMRLQSLLSHPDQLHLLHVSIIPPSLSDRIALLAVTQSNLRLYLAFPTPFSLGQTPSSLQLIAVRFPPNDALPIRSSIQLNGTYFTLNQDTSVTAFTRDFLQHDLSDTTLFLQPDDQAMVLGQVSRVVTRPYQEQAVLIKETGECPVGIYMRIEKEKWLPNQVAMRISNGLMLPFAVEGATYLLLTTSAVLVLRETTLFDQVATMMARDTFLRDSEQLYHYAGSVEATFSLLLAFCLPSFSPIASRIAAVLADKAGVPNYVPAGSNSLLANGTNGGQTSGANGANGTYGANGANGSGVVRVVGQSSYSNLYEGVVKVVSRTLLVMWNESVVNRECTQLRFPVKNYQQVIDIYTQLIAFIGSTYPEALRAGNVNNVNGSNRINVNLPNGSGNNSASQNANLSTTGGSQNMSSTDGSIMAIDEARRQELYSIRLLYFLILRCIQVMRLLLYIDSIGLQDILRLLPDNTRDLLTRLPLASLLNTSEGSHVFKHVVNAVLLYYHHHPIAVLYDVCDRLASLCGGYFSLGEKIFNQGRILLSRVFEDSFHVDPHLLQNALDSLVLSFKYFDADEIPSHLQQVFDDLTKQTRFLEFVEFALRAAGVLSQTTFSSSTIDSTKHLFFEKIVETLKLILVGSSTSPSFSRDTESRELLVSQILSTCISSGEEGACFATFDWLLQNHHLNILLSTRSPLVESFLKRQDLQLLHRYYLKNRDYTSAAEVMCNAAFADSVHIADRLRYVTSCLNDLNASQTGLSPQKSSLNMQSLLTAQSNLEVQAALAEDLAGSEERREEDMLALEERVLSPTELYNLAMRNHRDDACLRILRNTGFTDVETIRMHWRNLVNNVIHSNSTNKLHSLQTRIIALSREFHDSKNSPLFFPVGFLVESCMGVCIVCQKAGKELGEWITRCFVDCGVDYEELAHVTRDLVDVRVQSRWLVNAIWVFVKVVQEWILFIKTKNVDPNAKHRFVQAIEYLKRELENVKRQLEEIKDGTLLAQKEECKSKIERLIQELEKQEVCEKSPCCQHRSNQS